MIVSVRLNGAATLTRTPDAIDGAHQILVTETDGACLYQYVTAHEARRQAADWARIAIECDHADLGLPPPDCLAELVGPEPAT